MFHVRSNIFFDFMLKDTWQCLATNFLHKSYPKGKMNRHIALLQQLAQISKLFAVQEFICGRGISPSRLLMMWLYCDAILNIVIGAISISDRY
jgi:hypothetical protein